MASVEDRSAASVSCPSLDDAAAWEKLVLLCLPLSGGKLPPFPENPNNMYLWRLLDLRLTVGGCLAESLDSFLQAPVPRRCLEPVWFGPRHELYSSNLRQVFGQPFDAVLFRVASRAWAL